MLDVRALKSPASRLLPTGGPLPTATAATFAHADRNLFGLPAPTALKVRGPSPSPCRPTIAFPRKLPTPTPFETLNAASGSCTPPDGWVVYVVQPDNTLFSISLAVGSTVGELRDVNCLQSVDNIFSGQRLYVPRLPVSPVATGVVPTSEAGGTQTVPGAAVGCTDASTLITAPQPGSTVSGVFTLFGTASLANFSYYKIEIRPDFASVYNFYDRFQRPVVAGALGQVNTVQFGPGLYWVRLTVVDNTGNFPPPCAIPLVFK